MTDWIKDNKLAASLLLVAVLGGLGTFFFSGKKTEAFETAKNDFDSSASRLQQLEGRKPYPSDEKLKERRETVREFRGKIAELQKGLVQYRPKEFAKITPAAFTTRLTEVGDALKASYTDKDIKFPDAWQMGFEVYTSSPPKDASTSYLNYQLSGLEWLYQQLADAGVSELLNVYRPALPVEQGQPMMPENGGKGPGRGQPAAKPYFALPLELTFRGRESALRELLSTLAESKDYFYLVRSMRIQNVKFDQPPRMTDVEFEEAKSGGGDDLFSGFDFEDLPGDDGAPEEVDPGTGEGETPEETTEVVPEEPEEESPGTERILGQVLGDEEIHVFLQLELILFRDDVQLPEVK